MREMVTISMTLNELKEVIKESFRESSASLTNTKEVNEKPINQKQAADFLDVSQTTIIKWKKEGRIPYEQLPGTSKIRFYKSQLKAVLQKNSHLLSSTKR